MEKDKARLFYVAFFGKFLIVGILKIRERKSYDTKA